MKPIAKLTIAAAMPMLILAGCQKTTVDETPSETAIPVPTSVRIAEAGETSLTFSWKPVEGADDYTVRLDDKDGKLVTGTYKTTRETTVSYSGLTQGTAYYFKVRANVGDRSSDYCTPLEAIPGVSGADPEPDEGEDDNPDVPDEVYDQFGIPANEEELGALAFPGAEGGGMYVTGGRGGKIIYVTNLDDGGDGSLRAAVEANEARIVVFKVAGAISLKKKLVISNPNITIAGQTAPGDGICIKDNTVQVDADNVIIRFVRFRLGNEGNGLGSSSDAIWGRYHQNIMLDHCSMSWSIDEGASFYANRNFTMQWCIISEALNQSGLHEKKNHGYGGLWGGRNASFHHNLLADNYSRNARIDHPGIYLQVEEGKDYRPTHRGHVDFRNNVIYNYGDNSTYGGEDGYFNIVGNYYKSGPAAKANGKVRKYFVDAYWYNKDSDIGAAYPVLYLSDNYNTDGIDPKYPNGVYYHDQSGDAGKANPQPVVRDSPLSIKADDSKICYTSTHEVQSAFDAVLSYAGASLSRDEVDERVTSEARSGTASCGTNGIIDNQDQAGGWPEYTGAEVLDSDEDGLPDWFEEQFGVSDPHSKDLDRHGRYTNIEMYFHYLVKDIIASQNSEAAYTALD